ncbi:abstrakt protein SF II helicase and Znknuckle C2HC [Cryptosporidium ryanae]|uniref:abstrakt protein SF II helicase and Znknuckle C2HC n=1 Tax=Cryptosporidium ryanae TaxID=515981 RepID=UPI00351A09E0|nr:abstrakt protein SF II helicase and Znknuckle C2HC [Cryptosporidium ryanae]
MEEESGKDADFNKKRSLFSISASIREEEEKRKRLNPLHRLETLKREEEQLIAAVNQSLSGPLRAVHEIAKNVIYSGEVKTSWKIPKKYARLTESECQSLRSQLLIDVNGTDIPPPILTFKDMGFPKEIIQGLSDKGIVKPSQIQMQGLPVILQGRDLIGIAFTGSGKTIVFILPMIMFSFEAELSLPFKGMEGPHALVLCPSRELAVQTKRITDEFLSYFYSRDNSDNKDEQVFPRLRTACFIGGDNITDQLGAYFKEGLHILVATPGRLADLLKRRKITLQQCRYFCMDEADRLTESGFEEHVRFIFDSFYERRQTVLFSATMPRKTQEFAQTALINPIVVNVGRAGAANLRVIQEVEYVRQECRIPSLLNSLQKTAPRVLIFSENKKDVDDINEYLLIKGVKVSAIHGGLTQEQRTNSVESFRDGTVDVLVGTDVASKGLDFPNVQHVINFDMPREIENYVHRIGRTGRGDSIGVSTTFIDNSLPETLLCDLKALLIEANQVIPPFLEQFEATNTSLQEIGGVRGCAYCGGLGHRIAQCPKLLELQRRTQSGGQRDPISLGARYTSSNREDW